MLSTLRSSIPAPEGLPPHARPRRRAPSSTWCSRRRESSPRLSRQPKKLESRRVQVPVATIALLIAMKVLARDDRPRPQDRLDLAGLFRKATELDLAGFFESDDDLDAATWTTSFPSGSRKRSRAQSACRWRRATEMGPFRSLSKMTIGSCRPRVRAMSLRIGSLRALLSHGQQVWCGARASYESCAGYVSDWERSAR
jgi:hypothetical protein